MTTPRSCLHLLLPAALASLSGCALFDPDYEQDPDDALAELLAPFDRDRGAPPADALTRERARAGIVRLATRFPGHLGCQLAAATLDLEAGETDRARGFVDRALVLAPGSVEARVLRVRLAVADGGLDLARRLVDEGLVLRPDASPLYESSAWLYQLAGEAERALDALAAAERAGAPRWRAEFHRGLVEEMRGAFEVAAEHYRAALDAEDGCEVARQRLAGLVARGYVGG